MAEATPPGVIVVDGNHGGAKLPPAKAFAPVLGSTTWDSRSATLGRHPDLNPAQPQYFFHVNELII